MQRLTIYTDKLLVVGSNSYILGFVASHSLVNKHKLSRLFIVGLWEIKTETDWLTRYFSI